LSGCGSVCLRYASASTTMLRSWTSGTTVPVSASLTYQVKVYAQVVPPWSAVTVTRYSPAAGAPLTVPVDVPTWAPAGRPAADHVAEAPIGYAAGGDPVLKRALRIDAAVRQVRPDGWRGIQAREQVIKRALYEVLNDEAEVERIFPIIVAQDEY